MKSVLISIKPKWCELIASGKKIIEIRKTKPRIDTPFKCYIYETRTKDYYSVLHETTMGKVIGEFICSEITGFESEFWDDETYERIQTIIKDCEHYAEYGEYEYETVATNEDAKYKENWLCKQSCVSWEEMRKYVGAGITEFYGWHISKLKIYDKPKELNEFRKYISFLDGENLTELEEAGISNIRIKKAPQSWRYVEGVDENE